MKLFQLQLPRYCVLGIMFSFIASCSEQPENKIQEPTTENRTDAVIPSYKEKFIGEWKSIDSEEREHTTISSNGDNFIIEEGKRTVPGVWDEHNRIIRLNVGAPIDIMYIEKEDMIVFGNGKYRRVSQKQ